MDSTVDRYYRWQHRDFRPFRQISAAHRILDLSMAFLRLRNLSVEFSIYQGGSRSLKKMLVATGTL
jgi:hypothetical protein